VRRLIGSLLVSIMELSDQILTAFYTACLTLVGGCGLLLVTELLVKPYVEYRRIIGEVAYKLVLNANIIASASPKMERDIVIAQELRELAARLRASIASFPEPVRQGVASFLSTTSSKLRDA
jgi:hypothetical protein